MESLQQSLSVGPVFRFTCLNYDSKGLKFENRY